MTSCYHQPVTQAIHIPTYCRLWFHTFTATLRRTEPKHFVYDIEPKPILFEPDQQWTGSFVAATCAQMGRMSATQLTRLLLKVRTAGDNPVCMAAAAAFGAAWAVLLCEGLETLHVPVQLLHATS